MNSVAALDRLVTEGIRPQWWSPPKRSKVINTAVSIVKLGFGVAALSTLLHKDSRQWSLLWIGGAVGYFTHPTPGSEGMNDTVWRRVKLFWGIGPILGLIVSYPFFFDKMSFATVFVVGVVLGGEVYVQLHNRRERIK